MYPLHDADVAALDTPPVVDTVGVCLVKKVTLPMADSDAFKDAIDRRIDLDLKKVY